MLGKSLSVGTATQRCSYIPRRTSRAAAGRITGHVCRANASDAVILPVESRTFVIPSWGRSRSCTPSTTEVGRDLKTRITNGWRESSARSKSSPHLQPVVHPQSRGGMHAGGKVSCRTRLRGIPSIATPCSAQWIILIGPAAEVHDEHKKNPYDLRCVKAESTLFVEVKGTKSQGHSVLVTVGEVEFARTHPDRSQFC